MLSWLVSDKVIVLEEIITLFGSGGALTGLHRLPYFGIEAFRRLRAEVDRALERARFSTFARSSVRCVLFSRASAGCVHLGRAAQRAHQRVNFRCFDFLTQTSKSIRLLSRVRVGPHRAEISKS